MYTLKAIPSQSHFCDKNFESCAKFRVLEKYVNSELDPQFFNKDSFMYAVFTQKIQDGVFCLTRQKPSPLGPFSCFFPIFTYKKNY